MVSDHIQDSVLLELGILVSGPDGRIALLVPLNFGSRRFGFVAVECPLTLDVLYETSQLFNFGLQVADFGGFLAALPFEPRQISAHFVVFGIVAFTHPLFGKVEIGALRLQAFSLLPGQAGCYALSRSLL